ncbi:MAG TPA: phosphate signaling complex protein PhoU [Candidatus Lokiarchaeia archaeon]|nr:phosphate signaling complex protein PhoU [Candidatus Lokiarchaeia archaeon]
MTKKFHEDLDILKADVLSMGALATCFLERSIDALVSQDVASAKIILDARKEIIEKNDEIERKATELLTLYQPMARDIRLLVSILKIIEDLVRIGRYGKDIAALVEELSKKPHVKKLIHIPMMQRAVVSMVQDALDAFQSGNLDKIKDIGQRDNEVDDTRNYIFNECITYMTEDPSTITRCIYYILIARYLERCGDHGVKIAERAYYLYTGETIEFK